MDPGETVGEYVVVLGPHFDVVVLGRMDVAVDVGLVPRVPQHFVPAHAGVLCHLVNVECLLMLR